MRCGNCGKELEDNWKTCPYCGKEVIGECEESSQIFFPQTPMKKSKGTGWKIGILIVLCLILIGGIFIFVDMKYKRNRENKKSAQDISESVTTEEISTDMSTELSKDSSTTESNVDDSTSEKQDTVYSAELVIDSAISAQVIYDQYTGIYHVPYIDYEGDACHDVNNQLGKLGRDCIDDVDRYGSGCMNLGYKWAVNNDILSILVTAGYDCDVTEYTVYNINLNKDVILSKNDLLAVLNMDNAEFDKAVRNALDHYFEENFGDQLESDDFLRDRYDKTLASSNVSEAIPYIESDGALYITVKIYSIAGGEYYYHTIKVKELEDISSVSGTNPSDDPEYIVDYRSNDTSDFEYILPNSDSEYISDSDLDELTPDECRLALNEIYARHGRKFNDPDYQTYFNSKSWYNGTIDPDDFDDTALFNKYELANRDYIVDYEKRKGYK